MQHRIDPSTLFRWHLAIVAALAVAHVATMIRFQQSGQAGGLFNLDAEGNIPTLFATLALAAAAGAAWLLYRATKAEGRESRGWLAFSLLLALVAVDEYVRLHERLNAYGDRSPDGGWMWNPGVFPYAIVAAGLGLWLFSFWLKQSRSVRLGLAAGGILFVASAVGVEMIQNVERASGAVGLELHLGATVLAEEIGELVACALLLRAFLVRLVELGATRLLALELAADPLGMSSEQNRPMKPVPAEGRGQASYPVVVGGEYGDAGGGRGGPAFAFRQLHDPLRDSVGAIDEYDGPFRRRGKLGFDEAKVRAGERHGIDAVALGLAGQPGEDMPIDRRIRVPAA